MFVPGIIAVTLAYIAEESPPGTSSSITAAYVTGTVLGGMSGRFLTATVAEYHGWRMAFLFLGLMTAVCGLLTWRALPRSRRFVRQHDLLAPLRSMNIHLRNRRLLATYFVGFSSLFTLVGIFTYVNFYLAAEPFHLGLVALGSVFLGLRLGIVRHSAGWTFDRSLRLSGGIVAAAGIVVAGALLTLIPLLWCIVLGLAVLSSGIFVAQSAAASHVGIVAREARSSAAGLYVSFYYFGGSAGATILGWLWKRDGWPACIACVAVVQAISATVALRTFIPPARTRRI